MTGSMSKLKFEPLPAGDPTQRQPDVCLARERLQWEPRIQLREGLTATVQSFERLLSGGAPGRTMLPR